MSGWFLGGFWYVGRNGFSLNEGGRFAVLTVLVRPSWCRLLVYAKLFGWRWHRTWD